MDTREKVSLVELITVIALATVLISITMPIYANHRVRNRILLELEKLKSISQYVTNESGTINYSLEDLKNIPSSFHIDDNGVIALNTNNIVASSSISLVPTLTSGAIIWKCISIGLAQSQTPEPCVSDSTPKKNLVKSLYDPAKDPDTFTFIQSGEVGLKANCITYKCTIAEIKGKRWLAQYIDQLNIIQLYKEDSDYLINLYTDNLTIDPSIVNSELLQQFVDESML
ncbi:pilin [Francisella uliginis]|uniref:Uncharacterized protein n=1 Tax=Francisella uliginis TaxID=573570 RepID=A0A1L4BT08_9GAMM|nr:hypothetical protein [Francisella uliginis]API86978.1 hypothetical protein F7310_06235 [Francisella uliginis]